MGGLPLGKYDEVNDNLLMLVSKIGIATYLADTIEMDIRVGIRDECNTQNGYILYNVGMWELPSSDQHAWRSSMEGIF